MKSYDLQPRVHKAVSPGLLCPTCHSSNTYYSCKHQTHCCLNCLELFNREDAYKPPPPSPAKLWRVTSEGGHWYLSQSGNPFFITKEEMKQAEDVHIRPEHGMPGYDPIWSYNWYHIGQRIEERAWLASLTPEQIIQLKEQLDAK